MCMAPRVPTAPAPRNVLQIYGRTLDLDKQTDRLDYQNLQRLEAEGRIDRWGREIAQPASAQGASPAASSSSSGGETAPQAGSVAQKAEPPRDVTEGEKQARRKTAGQARVAGRSPAIAAGSRLGQGNSAKKTLLGG
ncbi:hypothetical protein SAMN06265365_12337 [Tistlia consotensis]|uniref:Uncharacterized protein n=1 Tax=Tistlia consotensis USBA 355 TaxID=560819 RepID=A0A1Y6CPW3_9PROT|nr:hypothetical protein [Tistlia consotensis]SMF64634.1 hypothetical protein SAMN05428998_12572 [Tistlia consotensis USBA 355]SNR97129.1 hypothetical protein SAMN06265365_12337 [Tistlia consotensis]